MSESGNVHSKAKSPSKNQFGPWKDLPMFPWGRHQKNLSSSFVVGQELGNISPRRLKMSVHRDSQRTVVTTAPHPWAQNGMLGICRGVQEEEGAWKEKRKLNLKIYPSRRASSGSLQGHEEQQH